MRPIVLFLLCGTALAQGERYVAYSMDGIPGGEGHWAFFGVLSTGNADEARSQELIPAPYLPANGGLITAMEVLPHATGTITYQRLDIQLGHTASGTLGTDMNANLPSPQTVYSAAPGTSISWPSAAQWVRIPFTTPFLYQGGSGLIVETRRVIQRPSTPAGLTVSHQRVSTVQRSDLPDPVSTEGPQGSGRSNAQYGGFAIGRLMLIRLVFQSVPTLTITSTRTGTYGLFFRLGETAILTVQGNAGELFANTIDVSLASPPHLIAPVQGYYYLLSIFNLFHVGVLDPNGNGPLAIGIPNNPLLVGVHVYFQSLTAGAQLTWTNAVDAVILQ